MSATIIIALTLISHDAYFARGAGRTWVVLEWAKTSIDSNNNM